MDPLFSHIIINDAYQEPTQHLNLLRTSDAEEEAIPGRRPAGYYLGSRAEADQTVTKREWRELTGVNKIRERVGRWRAAGYPGVTPVTRALLDCWNQLDRPLVNLFFCQREAAETIVWLVEAPESERAGLSEVEAPDAFTRYCTKMATGSGKTTVMAMLAAWSVINKVTNRGDARFADAVLVVCPNLTVKERLQVLYPSHTANEYDAKALLPPGTDFKERLAQGRFQISNWHLLAVQSDDGKRQILQRGTESDPAFCRRVLREIGTKENLLVFNDEAHHAYRRSPDAEDGRDAGEEILETEDLEEFEREATVWVEGLDRVHSDRKIRLCVDLTATPYYIARSGYPDGSPFPWIVSDFGLVDAVECGIVKIPRVPRGDDSGQSEPRYLHLWEHIRDKMPKRVIEGDAADVTLTRILTEAEGALRSLGYLWLKTFEAWQGRSEVPPCMIVVCNNTRTAELMANFIGSEFLPELRNADGAERTFRIDSALLRKAEQGEEGGDARATALRRKVATVGKPGTSEEAPGGQIRCVVSVAMLSEGWDARNVTQILGLRAFSSQLLCEQVIGRGLRRSSYENLAEPEFVDIYGIPFQLLPVQRQAPGGTHKPSTSVRALTERSDLEITFPRVVGFFLDVGTELDVDESRLEPVELTPELEPGMVAVGEGASLHAGRKVALGAGDPRQEVSAEDVYAGERVQTTVFRITQDIVNEMPEHHRPYLFKRVLAVVRSYVDDKVIAGRVPKEMIALRRNREEIANRIRHAIKARTGESIRLPIYDPVQPLGSTRYISFLTKKACYEATKSHVNYVVCDSSRDDVAPERLWEYKAAQILDRHPAVRSFVKNDHLDFTIAYSYQDQQSRYVPDFLVSILTAGGEEVMLILEVKGEEDNRDRAKYTFARSWVDSVNREGRHGRWAFDVVRNPDAVRALLDRLTG